MTTIQELELANQNAEKNAAGPCLAASWLVISNVALAFGW